MKTDAIGLTSSEIGVLSRIADLARRFGLRPSDADGYLHYISHPDFESGIYELRFDNRPDAPGTEQGDRYDKMMDALGLGDRSFFQAEHIDEIEDVVERALSLAPRARTVG